MGFEPTRAEHIGLAVQRLNHAATSSMQKEVGVAKVLSDQGIRWGSCACDTWRNAMEKKASFPMPGTEPGPAG